MKQKRKMSATSIQFLPSVRAILDAMAEQQECSLSDAVALAVREYAAAHGITQNPVGPSGGVGSRSSNLV
jgi:hypothetical protein